MVGSAFTAIALAIALARGAGPAPAPVRAQPPKRTPTTDRAPSPAPLRSERSPTARSPRSLDPAALQARVQPPRNADLRNPFERVDAPPVAATPPQDLKDPFARRRPASPDAVPLAISPDLHDPFAKRRPAPTADTGRSERPTPPPPAPTCTTAKGVPVQRPRAVRPSAPPCPAPAAAPRHRD